MIEIALFDSFEKIIIDSGLYELAETEREGGRELKWSRAKSLLETVLR